MTKFKMKKKWLTYKVIIPIILIVYTVVMLGIQLGLDKQLIFSKADILHLGNRKLGLKSPYDQDNINNQGNDMVQIEEKIVDSTQANSLQGHRNIFMSSRKLHRDRQLERILYSENKGVKTRKKSYKKVGKVIVYSAFVDNRTALENPVVRVIGMKQINSDEKILCHFYSGDDNWLKIPSKGYEMCENHGRYYGGWIFSCDIPTEIYLNKMLFSFTHIFLSSTQKPDKTVKLKVTSATMNSYRQYMSENGKYNNDVSQHSSQNSSAPTFGICLPPIFGDISLSLLIQFLELSKIIGASHFTFYEYSVPTTVQKLLNFYQEKGEVTVVNWKLPPDVAESEIWYHGQLLAIQDCLYRNMAKYDFLLFIDLDEFIIPVHNKTWGDMVEHLLSSASNSKLRDLNRIGSFSFKSAFFDPKQVPDPSHQLTFLQLLRRNSILSAKRTKLMVQPQKVFELGIHHVSKTLEPNVSTINVDPEIAKIHHYRPCIINYEPNMKCYSEVTDDSVLKYADELVERYQNIIRKTIELFLPSEPSDE